ncbi:hypothetical protein A3J19_02490 [Candidatus Daviesbacteria bacterium RIFCSPLOWO2_02_FULL_41_8]|uniref:Polymerase nucleotidyl transferase domain-containing protein n=2 Tax=Candidatus Daviesiibacteriota TaxID=1752718 RepID=A0A1F5NG97_9BACT|nr:MAG: hypothetical protein A2871_02210 [Candidatus Daviesbacteria bacterium RIFCSPHIGHO2_01_FULL_41_23]OGE76716.1 MAG: hypothetical protein A3J19_02490 [Candidatus Daviesbacteria bacterium RIFCSPLOWO2_02_FULL_41_8]
MTQSQIRIAEIKNKILPILKQAGVKKSSLFGSYVKGEETKSSDIDILVEPPKTMSLFGLAGLKLDLEEALNKEVDIVTYNSIHPLLKEYILKDQVRIL